MAGSVYLYHCLQVTLGVSHCMGLFLIKRITLTYVHPSLRVHNEIESISNKSGEVHIPTQEVCLD